jgi:hypothetical protein
MGHSGAYSVILATDIEGNTWRKIDRPSGLQHSMHQAQGRLCVCTIVGPNDSKLSIWILEDYGTNNWTLKHTVSTGILFGRINIRFGFVDWVAEYIVIIVHPEWNMIFFAGEDGTIIAYDMDCIRVHVIPACVFQYVRRSIKRVHLQTIISSLCSLVLGFISRAVNKARFDVSLCYAF